MDTKIGILLPKSDMFPTLARDFLNGFNLSFKASGMAHNIPKLIVDGIGNAAGDIPLRSAEKMILQENVDLTLAFCGFSKLEELSTFFDSYKKPLIHLDLGGNVLKQVHKSPYILHHSLNLCNSAYAAGKYAADQFGKKGALTASFYDGGYHLSFSFVKGYTDNGGEIIYNYVGPMDYKTEDFTSMIRGLEENQPDVVFTLFSYKEGAKVCKILADASMTGMQFVSIPLMTDEYYNLENYGLENIISVASWSFDDEYSEMQHFLGIYRKLYAESPNIFGLIGYEVGMLIIKCLQDKQKIPADIGAYFKNLSINTPRGVLAFTDYFESHIPILKVRRFQYNQTGYHNTVIDRIEADDLEQLYQALEELPYSGWLNPYICT